MMMEPDERTGPGRGFLLALGGGGVLLGVLVAAALVVPLQPRLESGAPAVVAGVTSIVMPNGAAVSGFEPASVTVLVGVNNTIVWTNQDATSHTVYSSSVPEGAQPFQSPILSQGDTFKVTLNATGTYAYYCSIHPSTMRGTIRVIGAAKVVIPPDAAVGQLNFSPARFVVVVGVNNTVTFVNQDGIPHTVTALDGSFDSQTIPAGGSWTHTFSILGTFAFECTFHPSFMKGSITVEAKP
jgi:plastocyanin